MFDRRIQSTRDTEIGDSANANARKPQCGLLPICMGAQMTREARIMARVFNLPAIIAKARKNKARRLKRRSQHVK